MRAVLALLRVSLVTAMQYRSEFLFHMLAGLLHTVSAVVPLWLVYAHTDSVGGWTFPEACLVIALFMGLSAMQGGIVEPNLGEVVEAVRTGTFDLMLVKPVDAQLLVSLRKVDPARLWDLLGAVVLGTWALWQVGMPTPVDGLVAAVMLVAGIVAIYGIWLLAVCASFYFVRVDNLRFLLWSVSDAGRWPVTVFDGWVRFVLTYVVPVGLITTFPALAIRGQWTASLVASGVVGALVFALGSRWVWKRSLASYSSASS